MSFREDRAEAFAEAFVEPAREERTVEKERARAREWRGARRGAMESNNGEMLSSLTRVRYAIGSTFRTWSLLGLSIDSTRSSTYPARASINVSRRTGKMSADDRALARKAVPFLYRCQFVHAPFKRTFDSRS